MIFPLVWHLAIACVLVTNDTGNYCVLFSHFRVYSLSLHTEYDVCNCNDELPNSFHVRLLQADAQFTSLVAEVQQYVASVTDEDPEDFVPKVNDACLVRYKESWQRATILEGAAELNWNVSMNVCFSSL